VYQSSPFMVVSTDGGESRPVYGGLCTVGGYSAGYFFPNCGGDIIYALDLWFRRFLELLTMICNFAFLLISRLWLCASQLCRG
jgi:hypothetical protein